MLDNNQILNAHTAKNSYLTLSRKDFREHTILQQGYPANRNEKQDAKNIIEFKKTAFARRLQLVRQKPFQHLFTNQSSSFHAAFDIVATSENSSQRGGSSGSYATSLTIPAVLLDVWLVV